MEPGLRERKKEQTRQQISAAARELFAARGFERVRVAEVARAAGVSEATVFNYFPTKEDLVFSGLRVFEDALLGALRDRPAGESVARAFGRFVLRTEGLVGAGDAASGEQLATVTRVITDSPALLAREAQLFDRYTSQIATLVAAESAAKPDDVEPWVVANALVGVQRGLVGYVRRQILAGRRGSRLARDVRAQAERAFGALARGLLSGS